MRKIFLAGHTGMVGSAILRKLKNLSNISVVTCERNSLNLLSQHDVTEFLFENRPDTVIIAAAKVGGIYANKTYPADFIYENLMIQSNLIHGSHISGTKKILNLGSSCIYPKHCPQPISESSLLSGKLEPTNEAYAVAKIAGIKLCESYNKQFGHDFRSLMPTNIYGPGDNFHPENSHVIPSLIAKIHSAVVNKKSNVTIWGTGTARRDFLHVDDLAAACVHILQLNKNVLFESSNHLDAHINVGSNKDISILELVKLIASIAGYSGDIKLDATQPDGTPVKLLDVSKITRLGWQPTIDLHSGIESTYRWYVENIHRVRS